jgi:hypothetical protein
MTNPYDAHQNAQKWTAEIVTGHLDALEKDASEGGSLFLGKALGKRGLYKQVWTYWKKKYADHAAIMEKIMLIETILEGNIIEGALKKDLSPYVAILTLKYNYRWTDRPAEVEEPVVQQLPESALGSASPKVQFWLTDDRVLLVGDEPGQGGIYQKVVTQDMKQVDRTE